MSLASFVMKSLAPRAGIFERSTKDPRKAQRQILMCYLSRNRRTEYGVKYDFSSIRSVEEFRRRVPLSDYEVVRPYVDKMKKGISNVLTADKVTFFGITSGTTGTPKLIPVTRYSQRRKDGLMDLWAYYACREHPRVVDGRILGIVSPEVKSRTEAGIPYGPEDGYAYNNLLGIVKRRYVIPYSTFYIDDYDARYYCILRVSMEHNITTIATLNPSTLVLLCERITALQDRIIDDIERGTLDASLKIPMGIRFDIEKRLKPNPRRARELRELLKRNGTLLPKHFWPRLELIECWKGGTVKFYISKLPYYFGPVAIRDFGCLSTEARSSVPMSDSGAGGVLAIRTNFYEFIPIEDIDKENKRVFLCNELESGKEYLLIVTTAGGLYRYNIDDVIRVTGFFNKTPIIEFVQKGRNAVSITGEKIYESHVVEAMNRATARHQTAVRSFCALAVARDGEVAARYVFLIEFEGNPSDGQKRELLASIDEELRAENSEYDDLRKQQLLAFPSLKVLRDGEFERYRRQRVSRGAHDTQFKMAKLAIDPGIQGSFDVVEEIVIE